MGWLEQDREAEKSTSKIQVSTLGGWLGPSFEVFQSFQKNGSQRKQLRPRGTFSARRAGGGDGHLGHRSPLLV